MISLCIGFLFPSGCQVKQHYLILENYYIKVLLKSYDSNTLGHFANL